MPSPSLMRIPQMFFSWSESGPAFLIKLFHFKKNMYRSHMHQLQKFLVLVCVHMELDFTPPEKSTLHFLYLSVHLFVFQQICVCKLVNLCKLVPSTGHNVRGTFAVWEKPCHPTNENLCRTRRQLNISGNNKTKMASAGRTWRNGILRQLELRKATETDPYTDLVSSRKF